MMTACKEVNRNADPLLVRKEWQGEGMNVERDKNSRPKSDQWETHPQFQGVKIDEVDAFLKVT